MAKLYVLSEDLADIMNEWSEDIAYKIEVADSLVYGKLYDMLSSIEKFAESCTEDSYEKRDDGWFTPKDEPEYSVSHDMLRLSEKMNDVMDAFLEFRSKFRDFAEYYDRMPTEFANTGDFNNWYDAEHQYDYERA